MLPVRTQGAVEVLEPSIPLKRECVEELKGTVQSCLGSGLPMLVLNLQEVPLVDSAGVDALLEIRDLVLQQGGQIKLAAPSPLIGDVLRITGLSDIFEVFDEERAAVRSFVQ